MNKVVILSALYLLNVALAHDIYAVLLTLPLFAFFVYSISRIHEKYIIEDDVLWFVMFIYFCIHPLQVITREGLVPNEALTAVTMSYSRWEILYAFMIVYLFIIAFTLAKPLAIGVQKTVRLVSLPRKAEILLFALSCICFPLFVIFGGGLENLLSPRYLQVGTDTSSVAVFPLAFMSVSALLQCAMLRGRSSTEGWVSAGLLFLLVECAFLAVCKNPFNSARFHLMIIWGPLVLCLIRGRLGSLAFYVYSLIGISVIFPILSYSTRFGFAGDEFQTVASVSFDPFVLQSVDIFKILVHTINYVDRSGFFFGDKTLAILLWFFPRAFWINKPIVGALDVGGELLYERATGTDNVSMLVAGDFYMDLGFAGVVIGSFLVGLIYYRLTSRQLVIEGQRLARYIWICALPILIRGPLGATIGLFCCELIILAILPRLLGRVTTMSPQFRVPLPGAALNAVLQHSVIANGVNRRATTRL